MVDNGLDPHEVAQDGFDDDSYVAILHPEKGRIVKERRPWPTGVDVELIRTLLTLSNAYDAREAREQREPNR